MFSMTFINCRQGKHRLKIPSRHYRPFKADEQLLRAEDGAGETREFPRECPAGSPWRPGKGIRADGE